jgi:regulator of sigma E protease
MLVSVLVGIFGISLLVIVHEAGHYFAARAFGMRVTRFSIGLGPVIVSHTPKGSDTTFQICAVPFLAYVMIAGMNPAEEIDPKDPGLFPNKGVFARIVTIFAGPFANYLAASVMLFFMALFAWRVPAPVTEPMQIAGVENGSPAALGGFKPGDVVVEGNGKPVKNVTELIEVTRDRAGKPTVYVIERDGKRLAPITITPNHNGERGVIGVTAVVNTVITQLPVGEAAYKALVLPYLFSIDNLTGIWSLIQRRTTEGVTGPVGMVKLVAQQGEKGILPFLDILIAISVALGLFNLLPIPALDGGRLVFLGYELITRRRANERFEATVHAVGILFLLGVIALVTLRDVVRLPL